jgi:hypothetical protein
MIWQVSTEEDSNIVVICKPIYTVVVRLAFQTAHTVLYPLYVKFKAIIFLSNVAVNFEELLLDL